MFGRVSVRLCAERPPFHCEASGEDLQCKSSLTGTLGGAPKYEKIRWRPRHERRPLVSVGIVRIPRARDEGVSANPRERFEPLEDLVCE